MFLGLIVASAGSESPGSMCQDYVCPVLQNRLLEFTVTMQMCSFMKHRLNYTIPDCHSNLEKMWSNQTTRLCHPSVTSTTPPGEIVEASRFQLPSLCKILRSKKFEDCGTTGMCVMLKQYLNTTILDCQADFEKIWQDEAGKYCQDFSTTMPDLTTTRQDYTTTVVV